MNLSRRAVLSALSALAAMPVLSTPALALSESQARDLVRRMADDIVATINSGRSDSAMFAEFEKLLATYADMNIIARFALGPASRAASDRELRDYTDAFQGYVARKYGQRFREFIGGQIEITGARADKRGVVVSAKASLQGSETIAVEFHTSDRSGSAKVFNVVIEGINLLTNERTEIGALLDQQGGSVSKLTRELERRS